MLLGVLAYIFSAGVTAYSFYKGMFNTEVFFKPLTLIILMFFVASGRGASNFLLLGLLCSLVGDILLIWQARFFFAGLISFLLAHIFYIIRFNEKFGVSILFCMGLLVLMLPLIRPILLKAPTKLKMPVLGYMIIIALMAGATFTTGNILLIAGGLIFCLSDTVLAWNRFVAPVKNGRVINILTYHLAQLLLVLGS